MLIMIMTMTKKMLGLSNSWISAKIVLQKLLKRRRPPYTKTALSPFSIFHGQAGSATDTMILGKCCKKWEKKTRFGFFGILYSRRLICMRAGKCVGTTSNWGQSKRRGDQSWDEDSLWKYQADWWQNERVHGRWLARWKNVTIDDRDWCKRCELHFVTLSRPADVLQTLRLQEFCQNFTMGSDLNFKKCNFSLPLWDEAKI